MYTKALTTQAFTTTRFCRTFGLMSQIQAGQTFSPPLTLSTMWDTLHSISRWEVFLQDWHHAKLSKDTLARRSRNSKSCPFMHSVILHLTRGFLSTTNHLLSLQMRKYLSILDNPMLILRAKLIHGSVSLQSECKKHNLLRLRQKLNICKILGASRSS